MSSRFDRRRFVYLVGAACTLGVAGCSEPSDEGEPPADEPPEGPVEDQNGAEDQEPGMGEPRENETDGTADAETDGSPESG